MPSRAHASLKRVSNSSPSLFLESGFHGISPPYCRQTSCDLTVRVNARPRRSRPGHEYLSSEPVRYGFTLVMAKTSEPAVFQEIICASGGAQTNRPLESSHTPARGSVPGVLISSAANLPDGDRKSTRLNSSHGYISYAVFCLKKKKT